MWKDGRELPLSLSTNVLDAERETSVFFFPRGFTELLQTAAVSLGGGFQVL